MRNAILLIVIVFITLSLFMIFSSVGGAVKNVDDAKFLITNTFKWVGTIAKNLWDVTGFVSTQEWLPEFDTLTSSNKTNEGNYDG